MVEADALDGEVREVQEAAKKKKLKPSGVIMSMLVDPDASSDEEIYVDEATGRTQTRKKSPNKKLAKE